MLDHDASRLALTRLFAHRPVADLPGLGRSLDTRSRMSVFRRLSTLGYLSSYTHTGRYYTLQTIPQFDVDGLWRFEGIGFSRNGTLKATVHRLVETSDRGCTQHELQVRLGVRVHNPLLALVKSKHLRRESFEGGYLYLAAARKRAADQLKRRREMPTAPPPSRIEVEVLIEVIHGARLSTPDASTVAARLGARGVLASVSEVAAVLERHGLKKTAPSHSRRSRR